MTYLELARIILEEFNEEQQTSDVTYFDQEIDEYFALNSIQYSPEDDVLDKGCPFLVNFEDELR